MNTSSATYYKAKTFVYRNARPLELALWQYLFENGDVASVLSVLKEYQNEDGGFGHALEPDAWNPSSSPIQTWQACSILRMFPASVRSQTMTASILHYLASGKDFNGVCWCRTVPGNNQYPHAPWWHCNENYLEECDWNPTASLAGFMVEHSDKHSIAHVKGMEIAANAIEAFLAAETVEPHTLRCFIELYSALAGAQATNFPISELQLRLKKEVKKAICKQTERWKTEYVCKPSTFFHSPESIFYQENRAIADYECEFIQTSQLSDGSWPVVWQWNAYPKAYAVSVNWWKSWIAIHTILYLKNFNFLGMDF